MSGRRLLLSAVYTGLPVVVALFFVKCHAVKSHQNCDHYSSSCGDIHNISYPFRLKGDPENCGNKSYELACENNRPLLRLFSGNFYVLAIDYDNYRIRLVDVGIQKGNCSSLPLYYLSDNNFSSVCADVFQYIWGDPYARALVATVYCENPVKSLLYMDSNTAANCLKKEVSTSFTSPRRHYSYVLFGKVPAWDVPDLCTIDDIVPTTMWSDAAHGYDEIDQGAGNFSYLYFHNMLASGFELSWVSLLCEECRGQGAYCHSDPYVYVNKVYCYKYCDWRFKLSFRCVVTMIALEYIFPGLRIIGLILVARTLCGMLCLFAFLFYMFRRRHLSMFDSIEGFLQSQNNLMPIRYSYSNIKKMTKGLKDKLGEGGYGSVYKGKLRSGNAVAIKILGKSKANGQDFINEVATIGRIHHVNVVQLIGFCAERSKRALVYDFMPNGSLEKYIFSQQEGSTSLSCKQMFEISLGVARGIEYLHRGCDMQILHFDIKPHNILLDENFTPKVSDFGLAKLYPTENSIVSLTAARGTMGYMAPELFYKNIGPISYKADVYSFGMLLMEMAGRRRNLNVFADHASQIYFPSWVYDQFKEGRDVAVGEATEEERQMVKKMIITALWCIQMKPSDRPSMNKVVEMLEGNIELLEMPPKPFLTPQEMPAAAEDQ